MAQEQKITGKMEVAGIVGPLWFAAWLFTVGYAQLSLGKAVVAAVLWPYFLGVLARVAGAD